MSLKETVRNFFILYNNGDVFYFDLTSKGEIYCTKFKNIYEKTKGVTIRAAHTLEFTGSNFILKDENGDTIYTLEEYYKEMNKILGISMETEPSIERLYIDEDVREILLSSKKIKYDESASNIPGLLSEPTENQVKTKRLIK